MGFGEPSKLDYAARLAAALGFVGLVNLERVGVGVVRDRMAEGWQPDARPEPGAPAHGLPRPAARRAAPTSLNDGLAAYALRSREAGLAVLVSDLLDPARLRARAQGAPRAPLRRARVHVLPPEEMNPDLRRATCA